MNRICISIPNGESSSKRLPRNNFPRKKRTLARRSPAGSASVSAQQCSSRVFASLSARRRPAPRQDSQTLQREISRTFPKSVTSRAHGWLLLGCRWLEFAIRIPNDSEWYGINLECHKAKCRIVRPVELTRNFAGLCTKRKLGDVFGRKSNSSVTSFTNLAQILACFSTALGNFTLSDNANGCMELAFSLYQSNIILLARGSKGVVQNIKSVNHTAFSLSTEV